MPNHIERRAVCAVYDDLASPNEAYPAARFGRPAPERVPGGHEFAVTAPSETIIGMINVHSQTYSQWRVLLCHQWVCVNPKRLEIDINSQSDFRLFLRDDEASQTVLACPQTT